MNQRDIRVLLKFMEERLVLYIYKIGAHATHGLNEAEDVVNKLDSYDWRTFGDMKEYVRDDETPPSRSERAESLLEQVREHLNNY